MKSCYSDIFRKLGSRQVMGLTIETTPEEEEASFVPAADGSIDCTAYGTWSQPSLSRSPSAALTPRPVMIKVCWIIWKAVCCL